MVGQSVTHATLGDGTITEASRGGSGAISLYIDFSSRPHPVRFAPQALANEALFTDVPVPLSPQQLEDLRREAAMVAERATAAAAERERRDADQRRSAGERHRAEATTRRSANHPRHVPSDALRDVLSVPVGDTENYVVQYEIHACPDSYSYRATPYITFRGKGGVMWRVYDLGRAHIFLLNPDAPAAERERIIAAQPIGDAAKERLRGYWADRHRAGLFSSSANEDYRFYVLPQDGNIELPHRPHPASTIQGHTYFDLGELQRGHQTVRILSRKGR